MLNNNSDKDRDAVTLKNSILVISALCYNSVVLTNRTGNRVGLLLVGR